MELLDTADLKSTRPKAIELKGEIWCVTTTPVETEERV